MSVNILYCFVVVKDVERQSRITKSVNLYLQQIIIVVRKILILMQKVGPTDDFVQLI